MFEVSPRRILHCGAHEAEELESYTEAKFAPEGVVWIEADSNLANQLKSRFQDSPDLVIEAALWSTSHQEMKFHRTSNTQSSSLLELGSHLENFPDITEIETISISSSRIDDFLPALQGVDFINLDIQGAELEALKGAETLLGQVKWIYTEVNKGEVYLGCAKIWEIDDFLKPLGFTRVATRWSFRDDFGDALYSKERFYFRSLGFQIKSFWKSLCTLFRYSLHTLKSKLRLVAHKST